MPFAKNYRGWWLHLHSRVAFFEGVRIVFKCPKLIAILKEPETFGEHIKQARAKQGLRQVDLAHLLHVSPYTVLNWEKDRTEPPIPLMPRVLEFLGYDPFPESKTLSERMLAMRRKMGWTTREAAKRLGVDTGSWETWERTGEVAWDRLRNRLEKFLGKVPSTELGGGTLKKR